MRDVTPLCSHEFKEVMMLKLVSGRPSENKVVDDRQRAQDHAFLLEGYLRSHVIRNFSPRTIEKEKAFLKTWFEKDGKASFYAWDVMQPITGRKFIIEYANLLIDSDVSPQTVRNYVGILSRYFSYILEHAYVERDGGLVSLESIYGRLTQPVSEYDLPRHHWDGDRLGIPLEPERLFEFYQCLKEHYLLREETIRASHRARNYCMAVLAGESGLRSQELRLLEIKRDLFFESQKIQTRSAKGAHGSGCRSRVTLFTPLARDTVKFYINKHRTNLSKCSQDLLFPNAKGESLSYGAMRNALIEMVEVANKHNIPIARHMGWHWFRRLFATRFIERFPDKLPLLIELLGHNSFGTVHHYIRHSQAWIDVKIRETLAEMPQ